MTRKSATLHKDIFILFNNITAVLYFLKKVSISQNTETACKQHLELISKVNNTFFLQYKMSQLLQADERRISARDP